MTKVNIEGYMLTEEEMTYFHRAYKETVGLIAKIRSKKMDYLKCEDIECFEKALDLIKESFRPIVHGQLSYYREGWFSDYRNDDYICMP